jgi:hypothetical protein
MSGSISRKRKHKATRQRSKEEVRWYTTFFADIIEDRYERVMFPNTEYTALTSDQIHNLLQDDTFRKAKRNGFQT